MTTFTVGQKVKILDDRRHSYQPSSELTILEIEQCNWCKHPHLIFHMNTGKAYSSYWFDPTQPVLKHLDKVKDIEYSNNARR